MKHLDKPKTRIHAPSVLAVAVIIVIAVALVALGFRLGIESVPAEWSGGLIHGVEQAGIDQLRAALTQGRI